VVLWVCSGFLRQWKNFESSQKERLLCFFPRNLEATSIQIFKVLFFLKYLFIISLQALESGAFTHRRSILDEYLESP